MYDVEGKKTTIYDIDLFRKQPCIIDMGRMYGSSLFQSPEEFKLGAVIDEVTNVYTLGATAVAFYEAIGQKGKEGLCSHGGSVVAHCQPPHVSNEKTPHREHGH